MHEQLVAVVLVALLVAAFVTLAFVLGSVAWLLVNA